MDNQSALTKTALSYTGQHKDGTGLLYYGARYYDPALGRFLSPDSSGVSAGDPQSLNRYSYVGNNPLRYTDPTGHCRPDDCDPGENYSPPDPGGSMGAGGGDGGTGGDGNGGNEGGAAAFASLVQTIDSNNATYTPFSSPIPGSSGPSVLCAGEGPGCASNPFSNPVSSVFCSGGGSGCATNPFPGSGSGVVCSGCATNPFPGSGSGIVCTGCAPNPSPIGGGILGTPPQPTLDGILASEGPINIIVGSEEEARQRALDQAGLNENNSYRVDVPLNPGGSQAPEGPRGVRTEYRGFDPTTLEETGVVVSNDPYGHYFGDNSPQNVGPHYGVNGVPGQPETRYIYDTQYDYTKNR